MKILITGSGGFVGKNLVSYLNKDDNELYALISGISKNYNFLPVENIFSYDTPGVIKNGDFNVIIHLAALAHDLKNTANPNIYYKVNYELTKQLYDEFLASAASQFIFISSVKAVADVVEGLLTETEPPNPQTHYGKSKLMAEQYIESCTLPANKSYYILRPGMIHGPGNRGNLNHLFKYVQRGIPYPLAAFDNKRSFLSIRNLCFIIEKLVSGQPIPKGVYNIADDEPIAITQLIETIAKANNLKAKLWNINPSVINALAKIGDKLHLPLNSERLNKLAGNYIISNKKIKDALQLDSLPISAQQGLDITVESLSKLK
jgi:nucleoside-diphosphate-sugar epimerase